MTKPKMIRCSGSGQRVDGPDEPTGTVFCTVCGDSSLTMKTSVIDGKKEFSVPEHKRRADPPRPKGVRVAPTSRRTSRRDSGRRR